MTSAASIHPLPLVFQRVPLFLWGLLAPIFPWRAGNHKEDLVALNCNNAMASKHIYPHLRRILAAWIAVTGLAASEHRGMVTVGGTPLPGATVTAIQADKKLTTTTDDQGEYVFADLADGVWTIEVEMLGFAKTSREIGVAPEAPSPTWDLKMLSAAELKTALEAPPPTPAVAPATATPAATTSATTPAAAAATEGKPGASTETKPAVAPAATSASNGNASNGNGGGRGTNNGRPSIRAAAAAAQQRGGSGFTRMDVNQTSDLASAGADNGQQDMNT